MRKFFESIVIRLAVQDTRAMRPDTLEEKLDDVYRRLSDRLAFELYYSGPRRARAAAGLKAWLP